MNIIYIINLIAVGIFGMVLSAAFCDIAWNRRKNLIMIISVIIIFILQGIVYFFINLEMVQYAYPVITHLPLIVVLCILNRKILWPTVSVLTAYLCCQMRRWLALLAVSVFSGDALMQNTAELVLTLPLLLILLRFIAPEVRAVSHNTASVQFMFGLVPLLYYGFDYLTRIYTELLLEGALTVVEFMPFVCSVAYLIFVLHDSAEGRIRSYLEQTQDILNLQLSQSVREIKVLCESQQKAASYRHDLRHHMQYISACIENERLEQAQEYIHEICSEIEVNKVTVFCENEAVNLILSAFAGRIKEYGIQTSIRADIPQNIKISESDLCVLLSNALENALNACRKLREKNFPAMIEVEAYEKNERLFLQIINSCDSNITFSNGRPVTSKAGHGIGVRSICAIVEQYGGIYSFSVGDGSFILRISV